MTEDQRPASVLKELRRLYGTFGRYRIAVVGLIALGIAASILSVIAPTYLSEMTDSVADSMSSGTSVDMDLVARCAVILLILYGTAAVLNYLMMRWSWTVEEINGDRLRIELSKKVSRIPVGTMDSMRSGDVVSRFVNDTDSIRLRSTDVVVDTVASGVMMAGSAVMMVWTEWRLGAVCVALALLGFVVVRVTVHASQKYYLEQSRCLGRLNNIVDETFEGLEVVNSFNGMPAAKREFGEVNDRLFSASLRARIMGSLMPQSVSLINNASYVVACALGAVFVLEGTCTYGVIVAFIVYVKMTNNSLVRITETVGSAQEVAASCQRIFEFLDTPEMEDESSKPDMPSVVKGDVSFEDVRFSYVPGSEVIHGLTLDVPAGSRIAIVGPTGAGKTTIANLLLRFYEPDSGRILIDGTDISTVKRGSVRRLFGTVLQESWMFDGTLRDNIAFGDPGISDSDVLEACDEVGLSPYLSNLPDGLDTVIADPGSLSVGQRQQVSIARALVRDAPLLILDEATSSVDTRTERAIQRAMDTLMQGRTSFIIAHRLSTILDADRILVIDHGRIVESGTHRELLARNGFYRNLYDSQFEYCE